jgi:hypothetical protein
MPAIFIDLHVGLHWLPLWIMVEAWKRFLNISDDSIQ